jgi:hypothetical protein
MNGTAGTVYLIIPEHNARLLPMQASYFATIYALEACLLIPELR